MPWVERALIVALCAIAIVVLVSWLVRTLRRDASVPPIEVPPVSRPAADRVSALYASYGWSEAREDGADTVPGRGPDLRPRP